VNKKKKKLIKLTDKSFVTKYHNYSFLFHCGNPILEGKRVKILTFFNEIKGQHATNLWQIVCWEKV